MPPLKRMPNGGALRASTLTNDPGNDWTKAFRTEIAACHVLALLAMVERRPCTKMIEDVLIMDSRFIFVSAL